ncbi:peptide-methionine (S)-S-oxide reductase [Cytophagales bacterium RKSG123]|nr:peptide-methionine (S)-S-oxide reductase [Xanthovirga aplysinae]
MHIKNFPLLIVLLLFGLSNCQGKNSTSDSQSPEKPKNLENLKTAYFASGCFWCVEAIFEEVKGVEEAVSGYSGGDSPNPTYEKVSSGKTRYAESVEVYYDPQKVSYETLLRVFFGSHDPTTLNRQGPDVGPQYRSVVFYQNEKEKEQTENYIKDLNASGQYKSKIVTEVVPFEKFYRAEEYHQNYEKRHPNNPYIRNVSIPRIRAFEAKFPELLKSKDSH